MLWRSVNCPSPLFAKLRFLFVVDPRDREIGEMNRENVRRLLSALALYPLTQRLGMALAEFQALVARAQTEAADPSLKAYFPL